MKKVILAIIIILTTTCSAYTYDIFKISKMNTTQIRLTILEMYDDYEELSNFVLEVAKSADLKTQNKVALALQQVFTSKASISAKARMKTSSYALKVMNSSGRIYAAADGSYRIEINETKPIYKNDDDYVRISEKPSSL